ncbi:hypothetical protein [Paenibacillus sp. FSL H8-0260]|uniref:hypothetical protein n=1 Tax=Paenibacillus sp. FSL H8-0260 TaxID=2921380 RepID=UPI003250780C
MSITKKLILLSILPLFFLIGCSDKTLSWKGQSAHWTATIKNEKSSELTNFTIKYIGEEKELTTISYQFAGQVITAKGLYDDKTYPNSLQIQSTSEKNMEHEESSVKLIIKWNNSNEEIVQLKKN